MLLMPLAIEMSDVYRLDWINLLKANWVFCV